MRTRLAINLLLTCSMVVSTSACNSTTRVDLQTDPSDSSTRAWFESGEEVPIAGYTLVSDGYQNWKGLVQLAPPDSVQFTPSGTTRRREFKVSRSDLASIDIHGSDARIALVAPAQPAREAAVATSASPEPADNEISVVTSSPQGWSKRSKERAITIGVFVAIVGAVVIGYAVAGQ